ncbi:MAG TPA: 16S rRNA (uracil(1498)-N(3))-methyltransferase [Burkholderiaceae bacterium]|nr:16S rRNA (uracil(1498)-N(3))-methyltransferase [Burkholderiaceae bacterium]
MPVPRIHVERPLAPGADFALGAAATRHVQVLRLQPGDTLTLFDGNGGQWAGAISAISRREVRARTLHFEAVECELARPVTLAVGMPANERMDALIEKATELGAARIQPLVCERSVLRVAGERALRKAAHWRAVAVAACEQCGRNRVPEIAEPMRLSDWLAQLGTPVDARWLLSTGEALPWPPAARGQRELLVLSGPEGGFTAVEEAAAHDAGFVAYSLGARVLRADTAPLAALAWIALEGS